MDKRNSNSIDSEERPWLSWICDSQSTDELKSKYDSWAKNYDADVRESWKFILDNVAVILEKNLSQRTVKILDAGAGTGLLGEILFKSGYTNISAVDLSAKMLEIAASKKVYNSLEQVNLEDNVAVKRLGTFDIVIATGLFAYAHAGATILQNLFESIESRGLFIVTIRDDYYRELESAINSLSSSSSSSSSLQSSQKNLTNIFKYWFEF